MVQIRLTETSILVGVDMVRWLLAKVFSLILFCEPFLPFEWNLSKWQICGKYKVWKYRMLLWLRTCNTCTCMTFVSPLNFNLNAKVWQKHLICSCPPFTVTSRMPKHVLERKVNTFAKCQPPKHLGLKGCWCNLHHVSGHVDFDGHIQKVICLSVETFKWIIFHKCVSWTHSTWHSISCVSNSYLKVAGNLLCLARQR